jgi:L-aspartate oxidase
LASNSLLEGLVFGARAGAAMRGESRSGKAHQARAAGTGSDAGVEDHIREIQETMSRWVGIIRDAQGLRRALEHLERLCRKVADPATRRGYEARNLQLLGTLVARSALAREESRGAHYRLDFPAHDDAKFLKHSVLRGETTMFV